MENTPIYYLKNFANPMGIEIYEYHFQDKRKKVKKYFAQIGQRTISPKLEYGEMNMFLLGWSKALYIKPQHS